MKAIVMMMKKKWIDGECHHICLVCPYWNKYCKVIYLPDSKYSKAYIAGFNDGYEAAKKMNK